MARYSCSSINNRTIWCENVRRLSNSWVLARPYTSEPAEGATDQKSGGVATCQALLHPTGQLNGRELLAFFIEQHQKIVGR